MFKFILKRIALHVSIDDCSKFYDISIDVYYK